MPVNGKHLFAKLFFFFLFDKTKKMAFNSRDGFSTKIWGPATWHLLRVISFNYPPEPSELDIDNYMQFIRSLGNVLPCGACRENYPHNLETAGFGRQVFRDRDSFGRFIYRLEQIVYQMTSKQKDLPATFEQNRATYECFRAKCAQTKGQEKGCVQTDDYIPSRGIVVVVPQSSYPHIHSLNVQEMCTEPV
jgi:hypothetical protein